MLAADPQALGTFWTASSGPAELATLNDQVMLIPAGYSPGSMWISDGTADGTERYLNTSLPGRDPVSFAGKVFLARQSQFSYQLWYTDGTFGGTAALSGAPNGVYNLTPIDGLLYFSSGAAWVTDGSPAGTKRLSPNASSFQNQSRDFTAAGTTVYFTSQESGIGRELWKTDGTQAGTSRLELVPGAAGSSPSSLTNVGGMLYFSSADSTGDRELWRTDGTLAGSSRVKDISATGGSFPANMINVNGTLYFVANDGSHGRELWRTDGTDAGTVLVEDLAAGITSSNPLPLIAQGDTLAFVAQAASGDWQLWVATNGVPSASLLADFGTAEFGGQGVKLIGEMNGVAYFAVDLGTRGSELWRTDGTLGGTSLVRGSLFDFGAESVTLDNTLYFSASDGAQGQELWRTDGTPEGTRLVKDVHPGTLTPFTIGPTTDVNGVGYFSALTAAGDSLVQVDGDEFRILVTGISPRQLTDVAGTLYFEGFVNGQSQLWTSDGTPRGTRLVKSFADDSTLSSLTEFNSSLYFVVHDQGSYQWWTTDGTEAGTVLIRDFGSTAPGDFVDVSGDLFFAANDPALGRELWTSDGTFAGTMLVRDIQSGLGSSNPTLLTNVAGRLYFQASEDASGTELWTSDGTEAGTLLVQDIKPGPGSSEPLELVAVGDELFFTADDGAVGRELWKAHHAAPHATLVRDVRPGPTSSLVRELTAAGGKLYFAADDGVTGQELWVSGGHAADTVLVDDIVPGSGSSFPSELEAVGWHLYFKAYRPDINVELWRTSGTPQSTIYWDFNNSPTRSQVEHLANVGGALYFFVNEELSRFEAEVEVLIVDRRLYYNNSKFDDGSAAADGAIAADKVAYLPGTGLTTTASVSNYSRGINGVMIDVANLNGELTVDDFTFRIGASNSPESWTLAPAPLEVIVRAGAGIGGSDRVSITWADGAIKNTWLQVIVEGNDAAGGFNTNTGLAQSDVFYFGNRVGDTFVGATALATMTNIQDELAARFNPGIVSSPNSLYDFNRDGLVNIADQLIARNNAGILLMMDVDDLAESLVAEPMAAPLRADRNLELPLATEWWRVAFALAAVDLEDEESLGY